MKELLGRGLPVCAGYGEGEISGHIALDSETAVKWGKEGKRTILVTRDTCPDDLNGMTYSIGILTARGGMTSHASLVAREQNKPCVVGCRELKVDIKQRFITFGEVTLIEGQEIYINGKTGEVYLKE